MRGAGPAQLQRRLADLFAMGGEAVAIGAADAFGAAENLVAFPDWRFKARAAGIGEIFFRRIDDAHQMTADAAMGEHPHGLQNAIVQKVAEPDQLVAAREGRGRRQGIAFAAEQGAAHAGQRQARRGGRAFHAQKADAFAAAHQQGSQRQKKQIGALALGNAP